MTEKQKRMVMRKAHRIAALAVLLLLEAIVAAIPAVLLSAALIPFVTLQRGYFAYGGEWFVVLLVFYGAYLYIHKRVCDTIFREEEQ